MRREKVNRVRCLISPQYLSIEIKCFEFSTNKGTKEKGYCIILSVPEPLSGKNFNASSISNSVEPHKDFLYEI